MKWFNRLTTGCGVMGMNYRNRHVVDVLNPKPLIGAAKDKMATKRLLAEHGIRTPATFAEIHSPKDVRDAYPMLRQAEKGFVVKPACSSRGRGVLICRGLMEDKLLLHEDRAMSRRDFEFFVNQILCGEYSFGRPQDSALIEQRVEADTSWILDGLPGAPDLRVITVKGKPVMAMARIPTVSSKGRANLHCGGIGVGIDLASGTTTHGVRNDQAITHHPDTGQELSGREVESLEECLRLAAMCYHALPLGYMGVDIMRDAALGPVVIELNARPGLGVQIANRKGLLHHLESL